VLHERAQPIFAPSESSPESFGHMGSSGCVTWADPSADVAWSILGTRHIANWWGDSALGDIGAEILSIAKRRGDG
jgi:CubicO group peptidase (beta-lactamase class C family)